MDTLVHDPFFDAVLELLGMTLEELKEAKDFDAWVAFELGAIDEATYLRRFFKDRRPLDAVALRRTLRRSYRFLDGVEPLLAELRARAFAMHALSNYSTWYRLIEEELRLGRYLEWSFVSCRTGRRKPAAEAFTGAAGALGVPPERCLFVDDKARNCEAARKVGMDAVEFRGAPALRDELVRRGLL
jgi:HAD superfamily hydrolase (TIGR01509 family)